MAVDMKALGPLDEKLIRVFALARRRNVDPKDAPFFLLAYYALNATRRDSDHSPMRGLAWLREQKVYLQPSAEAGETEKDVLPFFTKWWNEAQYALDDEFDADDISDEEITHSKKALEKAWPKWGVPRKNKGKAPAP